MGNNELLKIVYNRINEYKNLKNSIKIPLLIVIDTKEDTIEEIKEDKFKNGTGLSEVNICNVVNTMGFENEVNEDNSIIVYIDKNGKIKTLDNILKKLGSELPQEIYDHIKIVMDQVEKKEKDKYYFTMIFSSIMKKCLLALKETEKEELLNLLTDTENGLPTNINIDTDLYYIYGQIDSFLKPQQLLIGGSKKTGSKILEITHNYRLPENQKEYLKKYPDKKNELLGLIDKEGLEKKKSIYNYLEEEHNIYIIKTNIGVGVQSFLKEYLKEKFQILYYNNERNENEKVIDQITHEPFNIDKNCNSIIVNCQSCSDKFDYYKFGLGFKSQYKRVIMII